MIWSVSGYKEFNRCQRQWFYGEKLSSWRATDPFRREVYLMSNLSSIDAWRGNVVDYTITNKIIPAIKWKNSLNTAAIISYAKSITRLRYNFAKNKIYRQDGITKSARKEDFAAIFDFEYHPEKDQSERFKNAWEDIELSLTNFLSNADLIEYLKSADQLVTQKNLYFKYHNYTVRGIPDLIAFFKDQPPHIFDWKVHAFGFKTYQEQLMVYVLALLRGDKKGFPDFSFYKPTEIKISEYQLLKNILRPYSITNDYLLDTDEFIAESIEKMELLGGHKKLEELDIDDFDTTKYPENCTTCCFKKFCIGG